MSDTSYRDDTQQDYTRNFPDPMEIKPPGSDDPTNDLVYRPRPGAPPITTQPIPNARPLPPGVDPRSLLQPLPFQDRPTGRPLYDMAASAMPAGMKQFFDLIGGVESSNNPNQGYQSTGSIGGQYQQSLGFQRQYGGNTGNRSILDPNYQRKTLLNYARRALEANPRLTVGQFYSGYHQGTARPGQTFPVPRGEWGLLNWARRLGVNPNMPLASLLGDAAPSVPQRYFGNPYQRQVSDYGEPDFILKTAQNNPGPGAPGYMPQPDEIANVLHSSMMGLSQFGSPQTAAGSIGVLRFYANMLLAQQRRQDELGKIHHQQYEEQLQENLDAHREELKKYSSCYAATQDTTKQGAGDIDRFKQCLLDEGLNPDSDKALHAALGNANPFAAVGNLLSNWDRFYLNGAKVKAASDKSAAPDLEPDWTQPPDSTAATPSATAPAQSSTGPSVAPSPTDPTKPTGDLTGPAAPTVAAAAKAAADRQQQQQQAPAQSIPAPAGSNPGDLLYDPQGNARQISPDGKTATLAAGVPPLAGSSAAPHTNAAAAAQPRDSETMTRRSVGGPQYDTNASSQYRNPTTVPRNVESVAQQLSAGNSQAIQLIPDKKKYPQVFNAIITRYNDIQNQLRGVIADPDAGGTYRTADGTIHSHALDQVMRINPLLGERLAGWISGQLPPPSGWSANKPPWDTILGVGHKIDPSFTAQTFQTRQRTLNDFAAGADGKNLSSVALAYEHLFAVKNAMANRPGWIASYLGGNRAVGGIVRAIPGAAELTGITPEAQQWIGALDNDVKTGANEYERAITGGKPTVSGRAESEKDLDWRGQDANTVTGNVDSMIARLHQRMQVLRDRFVRGTGMQPQAMIGLFSDYADQQAVGEILKGIQ